MNILQWAYHWASYLSWLSVVMAGGVAGVRGRPALWNSKPPSWRHCSHSNSLTILRLYPCEYKLLQMQCHTCKTMRKFLQINRNSWNCSAINKVGIFCSPGSRSGFHIRIRIHGPDWIRIQSSSETLGAYHLFRMVFEIGLLEYFWKCMKRLLYMDLYWCFATFGAESIAVYFVKELEKGIIGHGICYWIAFVTWIVYSIKPCLVIVIISTGICFVVLLAGISSQNK
jgi:hypothetical protein